ncbi:hypothetical protein HGG78_17650 [Vibrio aestuarianus]|uniref:hypothetical protein n=1 Tax=Vibrio aestuarianus TaxID=28171 RepID=UPI001559986D|nr:hypothetical protein [Vibrio aestuarianus]NGZ15545.1 hypothetical protein [Vibrio aestuarianus]NKZ51693.1 hypothetical protein [Vibrio aestuarianus]
MMFVLSLMLYYSRRKFDSQKIEKKTNKLLFFILMLVFPTAVLTVFVQAGIDNYLRIFTAIAMRFVHTGQIFYMTYPDDILLSFADANGIVALFRDILGALRIVSWSELPVNHGLLAFQHHYPELGVLTGPNDRHNTFGLFYFGYWGAVMFSFLMGVFTSFIRNYLYKHTNFNLVNMSFYVLLVMAANNLNQDPSGMAVGYFFSIFMIFPPLFMISYFMFITLRK